MLVVGRASGILSASTTFKTLPAPPSKLVGELDEVTESSSATSLSVEKPHLGQIKTPSSYLDFNLLSQVGQNFNPFFSLLRLRTLNSLVVLNFRHFLYLTQLIYVMYPSQNYPLK